MRTRYLLLAGGILLYLAFLTKTYYWDGVLFSLYIEKVRAGELPAAILFHPNHLIYTAVGYAFCWLAWLAGLRLRALTVLQVVNVMVSAGAGYALYGLAKSWTRSAGAALFCWLLFMGGATWWKFSTDADSYIYSVLFVILAVRFASANPAKLLAAGACHVAAMLFHELAIFVYAPVVTVILLDSRHPLARRLVNVAAYGAATSAVVTAAYLACYQYADHTTYPTLLRWITSYASDSDFTRSWSQVVGGYLMSYLKLFAGGKLSFLRDYFSVPLCLGLLVCLAALGVAIKQARQPRETSAGQVDKRTQLLLWVWFGSSALFLGMWDPGSTFHKLFVWPPLVLLLGTYARVRPKVFVALAIALIGWNFAAFIYPRSHDTADPVLMLAEKADREMPKNARVYYRQLFPDDWYLEYFAPGRTWAPLPDTLEKLKLEAGPVCLETTALQASSADTDPLRRWDLVNQQHHIRLECLK